MQSEFGSGLSVNTDQTGRGITMKGYLKEKVTGIKMRRSERYDYLKWVNYDPESATPEDIKQAKLLAESLLGNKDLDVRETLTLKGYFALVLSGAIIFVLPMCYVAEALAIRVFGFANCSAPYWGTYAGTLLVLGSLWSIGWLWTMEKIKNAIMTHRAKKLNAWADKAENAVIGNLLDGDFIDLTDFR